MLDNVLMCDAVSKGPGGGASEQGAEETGAWGSWRACVSREGVCHKLDCLGPGLGGRAPRFLTLNQISNEALTRS